MEAPSSEMRSWRACSSTSTSSTAAASSFTWLMGRPLAHGRVEGVWGNREVPPLHQRRGSVGETWFPPRERAEGERRSLLLAFHRVLPAGRGSDPRHVDDLLAPDDERPRFPLRARDLGVHEEVLHLQVAVREPVARAPAADVQATPPRAQRPAAPSHLAVQTLR